MAIAALLIANSHLERFYPHSWLAGDGLIGNSLFFMLAGYGLVRSERNRSRGFLPWLWRRVVRIYPALFLVVLTFAVGVNGGWRSWSSSDYLEGLLWPTRYTFVWYIMPFYPVFYLLMRVQRRWVYPMATLLITVVYFAAYTHDVGTMRSGVPFHLSDRPTTLHVAAYLQIMLLGGWLAWSETPSRLPTPWGLVALVTLGGCYVGAKLLMVLGHGTRGYPLLHLLTYLLCLLFFDTLASAQAVRFVKERHALWLALAFVGGLTLEIYLVHEYIAEHRWVWGAAFPLNLAIFWVLTLPLAYVTGKASGAIQRRLSTDPPIVKAEGGDAISGSNHDRSRSVIMRGPDDLRN
jgi:peptidoglycan/LPS O-acetylase OafA/YrhL